MGCSFAGSTSLAGRGGQDDTGCGEIAGAGKTFADKTFECVQVDMDRRNGPPDGVQKGLAPGLTVEAVIALDGHHPSFGGLSGIWIAEDGGRMIAIGDSGQRWQARLDHDADGRLIGVGGWTVADLPLGPLDQEGTGWIDSEALTAQYRSQGETRDRLVVAFEGMHRLGRWSFDALDAAPERITLPDDLGGRSNSGIEALATLEDGRLFALAERVGAWGGEGLMGWVIDGRAAEDLIYMPAPGFSPTGAVRLDDMIYVIERKFSFLGGFRSRLVALPTAAIRPGARLEGTELAAFRWGDLGENFEGIEARRAADGRILLYLLTDDNFSFLQETLLVQMALSPNTLAN